MDKSLILNKIKSYLNLKSDTEFANFLGIKPQVLSNWRARNTFDTELIYTKCVDIDANWLLTGEGEMLKSENTSTETSKEESVKGIPLVNATAIGGYGNNVFSFEERDVKDYYVIPKFKHKQVDFMIEVEGSSMYPKYNSGDVVACRIIKERNFIQWNKTHVIATREQGIIIKRIKPSDAPNSLLMVSDNESYDPFNVPEEEIEGLAIVVGVIRLE
jgi:bacteriophage CI repressor helix-turn-helix domain